jgi:hypothetical protein
MVVMSFHHVSRSICASRLTADATEPFLCAAGWIMLLHAGAKFLLLSVLLSHKTRRAMAAALLS